MTNAQRHGDSLIREADESHTCPIARRTAIARLRDPALLQAQLQGQREAIRIMAGDGKPAAVISAETILKLS